MGCVDGRRPMLPYAAELSLLLLLLLCTPIVFIYSAITLYSCKCVLKLNLLTYPDYLASQALRRFPRYVSSLQLYALAMNE